MEEEALLGKWRAAAGPAVAPSVEEATTSPRLHPDDDLGATALAADPQSTRGDALPPW